MTYRPPERDTVVVDRGGYGAGVIAGAVIVVLLVLLAAWYLFGGLGSTPQTSNGGGQQNAPTLQAPSVAPPSL
jgi:hypothetical protein